MNTWLTSWLIGVALLTAPASLCAQTLAHLAGRVTVGGTGLPGVAVEIRRGEQVLASGSNRPTGQFDFELRVFDDAVYQVRLQHATFGSRVIEVSLQRRTGRLVEPDLNVELSLELVNGAGGFPTGTGSTTTVPNDDNHAIVKVFYATDRSSSGIDTIDYGSARNAGGKLHLGRFDVSVPRDRRMGTIERPTILTFWRADPARHFIIVNRMQQTYDQFYREVGELVARSTTRAAFVFVHGYNVAFEAAIYRTAQLTYDLGFEGAPILYSWPSEASELSYPIDANNSEWTAPHLRWFLEDVSAKTGAQVIHLIAHSMGNQPLVKALREISLAPRTTPRPRFKQIVLTAPDIDVDTLRQLATAVTRSAERVTLYASSNDVALKLSKKYQGYQRAGDSSPEVVVIPGMDTIDVSALDSTDFLDHSYYGDNRSVLADLFALIKDGLAPADRFGLVAAGSVSRRWWVFRP
jgi:esterase/lipase superfamily enzyme